MSEPKWTPGPWQSGGCVVWKRNGDMICDLVSKGMRQTADEVTANAHLITAAPLLYEELQKSYEVVMAMAEIHPEAAGLADVIRSNEAAIAAARGEQP